MILKLIIDYLRYIRFLIKYYLINLFIFKKSLNIHGTQNYQVYLKKQLKKTTDQKKRNIWLEEDFYNNKTNAFIYFFLKYKDLLVNSKKTLSIGSRVGNEVLAIKSYGCECIGIDLMPFKDLVIKGDMHNLDFNDNTFDFVFTNIIDHSLNPKKFFDEVYRILKPNGYFLIQCSFMFDDDEYTEYNIKGKNEIRKIGEKFSKITFKLSDVKSFGFWGFEREILLKK